MPQGLFYGMATVIAFGLAVGTIFTLGIVPVLYALLFGVKNPAKVTAAAVAARDLAGPAARALAASQPQND